MTLRGVVLKGLCSGLACPLDPIPFHPIDNKKLCGATFSQDDTENNTNCNNSIIMLIDHFEGN